MAAMPDSADPGWDDDLAWLDRDPVTHAEREAALDRLCELDEPDLEEEDWDHDDLTAEELAEILRAAADEVVAAKPPPDGFAGRATLTVPLATLLDLADRPGEIPGIGPVDPWLARDLADAAARNPTTTWCMTVTDQHGHRLKQRARWKVGQLADGTFRWTTPAGRSYDTEPTRYPI